MGKDISSHLLNRGNAAERQLGRLLKRGRLRHVPDMVQMALDSANQVLKDFGAAPATGAMQTGAVNVNTYEDRKSVV